MRNSPGRRAAAYWFVDGFPEIVLGAMLVICGVAGMLCDLYAPLAELGREFLSFLIVAAGFVLYFFEERTILDWLKARITYPRTGYVQPPEEAERFCGGGLTTLSLRPTAPTNENVSFFRVRMVMTIFSFFYVLLQPNRAQGFLRGRLLLPLLMATLALALFVVSRRLEHRYGWRPTLVLALLGLPFLWVRIAPILQPMVGLCLTGGWMVAQGLSTLIAYLHANPLPRATDGVEA